MKDDSSDLGLSTTLGQARVQTLLITVHKRFTISWNHLGRPVLLLLLCSHSYQLPLGERATEERMSVTETSRTTTRRRTRPERSTSSTTSSSSSSSRRTRGGRSTRERSTSTPRTERSETRSETTTRSRRRPTRPTDEEAQVDLSPEATRISSADSAERGAR